MIYVQFAAKKHIIANVLSLTLKLIVLTAAARGLLTVVTGTVTMETVANVQATAIIYLLI